MGLMASQAGIRSFKGKMFSNETRRAVKWWVPVLFAALASSEPTWGSHVETGILDSRAHPPGLQKKSNVGHIKAEHCGPLCI